MASEPWVVGHLNVATDLEAVREIDRSSFSHPWTEEMFLGELARPVSSVFVIRDGTSRVVGYCAVWVLDIELHINNLAISPSWRRQGAARTLLRHVMAASVRQGARRATLEVRASNTAARRLYEGVGFRVTGRRQRYYSRPADDALILWRDHLAMLETPSTV